MNSQDATLQTSTPSALKRAWYSASISDFLASRPDAVLGQLTDNSEFTILQTQRDAWRYQIAFLQSELIGLSGAIYLEFTIPRVGRRIDVVLVIGPALVVVEFKVGDAIFGRAAGEQVWDYALDLKNFHEGSHSLSIVPILLATEAADAPPP